MFGFQIAFHAICGRLTQTGLSSLRYLALVRSLLWSSCSSQPHFSFTFPPSPNPRPTACAWYAQYMKIRSGKSHTVEHLLYQTCRCRTMESFLQEGLKGWHESLQERGLITDVLSFFSNCLDFWNINTRQNHTEAAIQKCNLMIQVCPWPHKTQGHGRAFFPKKRWRKRLVTDVN